jgi:hypothetical protein
MTKRQKSDKESASKVFKPNLFGAFLMAFLGLTPEDLVKLAEAEGILSREKKSGSASAVPDSLGTKE